MAKRGIGLLVAVLASLAPATTAGAAIGPAQVEALDRQGATAIVVRREPGLSAAERAELRADADVTLERRSTLPDTEVVEADRGELAEAVAALNAHPDVVYAEPVTVQSAFSADTYFPSLWALENVGQRMYLPGSTSYYPAGTPDADMDVTEAWGKATGAGVTVAVVDTGVLATHPDLVDQLASNPGEAGAKSNNGIDDDGNGYVDDWRGWDFVQEYPGLGVSEGDATPGPDNDPQDNHGHGTHVAGTVAAQRDNGEGIAGVAPGAKVLVLRALGATGRGSSIAIAEAFDYAGRMGVRVVNASLGGPGLDQSQLAAIQAHPNTLYVIAAGNDNVNVDATPYGPCALPAPNILCVGASDEHDRKAGFSNYGAAGVDVFAPGTAILSTHTGAPYAYLQGTSMASPNTAGVAALVLSARPGVSALDVKSAIMAATEAKHALYGLALTGGRVNADLAVTGALGGAPVNVTGPVITGTPREGIALAATSGTWDPPGTAYAYTWQRSPDGATWETIPGAAGETYTPGASDIGARVRVTVTATNPFGVAAATSQPVGPVASGAPVNVVAPVIHGTTRRGHVLTVIHSWSPTGSYGYQWLRDGVAISGATGASYTLTTADRDAHVSVRITATNAFGQASVTSAPVGPVLWDPPVNTSPPSVSGTTRRTHTLTAAAGTWEGTGNTYRYQWQRETSGWTAIAGATAAAYKLGKDDEGARVRVLVSATNADGTVELASEPTELPVSPFPPANVTPPVVSGTPQRSKTLTATRGDWTGPDNLYSFQWQRDFGEGYVDIEGATGSTYKLAAEDVGTVVRVVVTASNPDAAIQEASAPTTTVLPAGPVNLSPPLVTGSAQRGATLAGTSGSWGGIGNSTSYRWQSSADGTTWTDIPGATTSSYAIGVGDIGRRLRLLVTVTNPDGAVSAASAATDPVVAAPPVNTAKPAITGTPRRGAVLTAGPGAWRGNGNTYAYRWQRDGTDVATGQTYTLTAADVGATLRVLVTATNPDGSATESSDSTATVAGVPPVNTVRPVVSGLAQRGLVLTGTPGTWSGLGNELSYQWQSSADGVTWGAIAGATSPKYTLAVADVGSVLRLLVTATNPDGVASAASAATAVVAGSPPVNTAKPVISGTLRRGSTLTASTGGWTGNGNSYAFQWQRDGADVATGQSYTLTADDVGATLRVLVTATNPDGTASAASAPTAPVPSAAPVNTVQPSVAGAARRGATLTAAAGAWTGTGNTIAYAWERSLDGGATWETIAGATRETYALAAADVGALVRVLVTVTNPDGSASRASEPTEAVSGDGPVNTAAPTITGTARRGELLTASPGSWSGEGNQIAYQWQRDGVDIEGATGPAYTLTVADVGAVVRVVVTATNPDGSASRASAPTAAVAAAPPVNTVAPVVTGAAVRTTTLSAEPGTWSGAGNTYAFQWQREFGGAWADIPGATGATYVLGVADVHARVRVLVTATNPDGSASAASIGSSVVKGGPPVLTAAPVISGTAKRTHTLTATPGEWDGIGNAYAYRWQRDGVDIATGPAYTLAGADVGAEIRVLVTASNPDGSETATSAAVGPVQAAPPENAAPPAISGPARLGAKLTASPGDWTPGDVTFAYRWERDSAHVADGATYVLTGPDVGAELRVRVTATNADGSASAVSAVTEAVAAPPANTVAPPAPAGTARETSTLTARPGSWDTPGATFSYSWWRCPAEATAIGAGCEAIGSGATRALTIADVGHRLGVRVTASSRGGETTVASALTDTVARLALTNVAPPSVAGAAYVGESLAGDPGRWSFASVHAVYDWRRCDAGGANCVSVGGGASRYLLTDADVGHTIVLSVAVTASGQSATASSAPVAVRARPLPRSVAAPSISGTFKRTHTLHADPGTWTNDPSRFGYQWLRDGAEIAGATGATYVLTRADVGHAVAVAVTARNEWGQGVARSAAGGPVAAAPPVNLQPPVIESPHPVIQQGLTLSVGGFAWDAPADTQYALSWERCAGGACHVIPGATGARYTLVAADVGHTIVAVSTAANVDATVSARSAQTAVATIVARPRWTTLPQISGGSRVGDAVTTTPGAWSAPAIDEDTVELMRCTNVCVPRSQDSAYTIGAGDLGAILRVRETASNAGGETVVWSSRYVGPVINAQAAAGVLSARATPLRNARGSTLALASVKRSKVTLRRAGKVKGTLTAWACEAKLGSDAPVCSRKVKLRAKATLRLPSGLKGKVRAVVVKGRGV